MDDEEKVSEIKGILKGSKPVSLEEMEEAIRAQAGSAMCDCSNLGDDPNGNAGEVHGPSQLEQPNRDVRTNVADMLDDIGGADIEYAPPKFGIQLKPPKL